MYKAYTMLLLILTPVIDGHCRRTVHGSVAVRRCAAASVIKVSRKGDSIVQVDARWGDTMGNCLLHTKITTSGLLQ